MAPPFSYVWNCKRNCMAVIYGDISTNTIIKYISSHVNIFGHLRVILYVYDNLHIKNNKRLKRVKY